MRERETMEYPLNPRKLKVGMLVWNSFIGRLIIVTKKPWKTPTEGWTWQGYDITNKKHCCLNCTSTYWEIC